MSEGGGTPKFSEAVNKIIAEDRNIEPLITGLINVLKVRRFAERSRICSPRPNSSMSTCGVRIYSDARNTGSGMAGASR